MTQNSSRKEPMKKQTLKTYSLEEITDKHIGKHGTQKRDAFENEIQLAIVGDFSKFTSKSLKDFIFESNKGKFINFIASRVEFAL